MPFTECGGNLGIWIPGERREHEGSWCKQEKVESTRSRFGELRIFGGDKHWLHTLNVEAALFSASLWFVLEHPRRWFRLPKRRRWFWDSRLWSHEMVALWVRIWWWRNCNDCVPLAIAEVCNKMAAWSQNWKGDRDRTQMWAMAEPSWRVPVSTPWEGFSSSVKNSQVATMLVAGTCS